MMPISNASGIASLAYEGMRREEEGGRERKEGGGGRRREREARLRVNHDAHKQRFWNCFIGL
jgi:hypothetical protein